MTIIMNRGYYQCEALGKHALRLCFGNDEL